MTPANINPYLISGGAGIICAILVIVFLGSRRPHDRRQMFLCGIAAIAGMFIGAHLLYFLVGLPDFSATYGNSIYDVASFLDALFHASSGMVFYGGLFGALLGVWILCRVLRFPIRSCMNIIVCAFPMMHACGRIGCALGGCCYGMEYHGICAIQYTAAHINPGISDHIADFPRFPVQPVEAALEFGICVLLVVLYLKNGDRYPITPVYLLAYGIVRFCDEFVRGDEIRGFWGPLSTSQWIALASILGTVLYYLISARRSSGQAAA